METIQENPTNVTRGYWLSANHSFSSTKQSGKWCLFTTKKEVDNLWRLISDEVGKNNFAAAKVSTKLLASLPNRRYVICVYTPDWEDQDEVFRLKDEITKLGFVGRLKFKRDIDTMNGVSRFVY